MRDEEGRPTGAQTDASVSTMVAANAGAAAYRRRGQSSADASAAVVGGAGELRHRGRDQGRSAASDAVLNATFGPDAQVASAPMKAAYASQLTADATTTVAQLNAWLAAGSALGVKRLVGAASINAPLITPSDTYLEATGATITLTVAGNMAQYPAVTALRNGSADAVVTAGSTTITTATGAFTGADVGRTLAVKFVDTTKGVNAYARIVTVNSATSVVVDTAPQFTETGGIASVYGRDKNIHVRGGKWQRTSLGGAGNAAHSLFFRRVDNSSVKGIKYYSQGGKYAVSYGDYTNVLIEDHYTESSSDAMHFTGPGTNTVVRGVTGTSGDDTVPFTTTDYGSYNDCHGDFKGIHISDVRATPTTRLVLLATSASESVDGHSIDGVKINDVERIGGGTAVYTEVLADDPNSRIDNLFIDNAIGDVVLRHVMHGVVDIRNLRGTVTLSPDAKHSNGVVNLTNHVETLRLTGCIKASGVLGFANAKSTIGSLEVRSSPGLEFAFYGKSIQKVTVENSPLSGMAFIASAGTVIGSITFRGSPITQTGTNAIGWVTGNSTVTSVTYDDCTATSTGTNYGDLVKVDAGSTVNTVRLTKGKATGIRGVLQSGGTVPVNLTITDTALDGCNRIVQGSAGAVVTYANVQNTNGLNTPFFATTGPLTLTGTGFTTNTSVAFDRSAAEVVRVIDPNLKGDISKLAKNNGDAAFNTNAALACGTGPAVSNGTNWKNVYSAAVY